MMSRLGNKWKVWVRRGLRAAEFCLPTRRVVAIDPGNHCLKLALVEKKFGRVRQLRSETISLSAESRQMPEETTRQLQTLLAAFGPGPLALAVPQHLALSELIDPPLTATTREVDSLIKQETLKLSGLSGSAMVHDSVILRPFGKYKHPVWVTLSQESRLFEQISRLHLAQADICEITPQANALIAAYLAARPEARNVILIDLGAASTVLGVIAQGQGVRATSFSFSGDLVTKAIASDRNCSLEAAEQMKRAGNLFVPPDSSPKLRELVDQWRTELLRNCQEFVEDQTPANAAPEPFRAVVTGGGALQPGLIDYLNGGSPIPFEPWPETDEPSGTAPGRFAVAFGTALTALGRAGHSLLPQDLRATWDKRFRAQLIQALNVWLLIFGGLLLFLGTWQKLHLVQTKSRLLTETRTALQEVQQTRLVGLELQATYERLRPVFERQRQTLDVLRTLALLQKIKTNRNLWFVLFADQLTYFSSPTPTNTNSVARLELHSLTNAPVLKYGFVAEVCLAEQGEAMRTTLTRVVEDLKADALFANVDSLPADRRRNLADPKVVIADRCFSLALDCTEHEFRPGSAVKSDPLTGAREDRSVSAPPKPKPAAPLPSVSVP